MSPSPDTNASIFPALTQSSFYLQPPSANGLYQSSTMSGSSSSEASLSPPPQSTAVSSPRGVKRGRPQQQIRDSDDASSLRKKHRRLYARQYRAQIRQTVDEVSTLREENAKLRKIADDAFVKMEEAERRLRIVESERAQKDLLLSQLLSSLLLTQQQPTLPMLPFLTGLPATTVCQM